MKDQLNKKPNKAKEKIVSFIRNEVKRAGSKKAVLGLSGGIDSALTAYLAVEALGKDNVIALLLPYETSSRESIDDAVMIADGLGIRSEIIDITPMINIYFDKYPNADMIRRGNKMARERMSILYDHSRIHGAIVLGTGNRTELLLGYGTIHGDMACGIAPLLGLYKTQVRALAKLVGVPAKVQEKVPTADLWKGQTDEGELGIDYPTADKVLILMVDNKMTDKAIINKGYKKGVVELIREKIMANEFKRKPVPYPKMT